MPYCPGRVGGFCAFFLHRTYINESLSRGRWHKLHCTYDAFIFDNKFNSIIKYVTTLLFNVTTSIDNKKNSREILFILDEVTDTKVSASECKNIKFNPLFTEFETVRVYCYLFLSNSISFNYKNDLKLFAFLLPMDYIFEDFIYGFIKKEIPEIKVKSQQSDTHLDTDKNFLLKPDLILEYNNKRVIADAKYKTGDLSQSDLYQMVSYAIRFNIDEIILFYPETIDNSRDNIKNIIVNDKLANNIDITIKVVQLPIMKTTEILKEVILKTMEIE